MKKLMFRLPGAFLGIVFALSCGVSAASAEVALKRVVAGFSEPVFYADPGDGTGRTFLLLQPGFVKIVQNGRVRSTPFLDIRKLIDTFGGEQGLLGLAFDPHFKTNHRFFVNYTRKGDGATIVSSFTVSRTDQNRADPRSEKIRLRFAQPFDNHNGGMLAFGPDRYLYIGTGDGGSEGDPFGNGQKLNTLLGKLLRIDVSAASSYRIPRSNPFVGRRGARPEIYAYGLRNPWRFSFDRKNGRLFVGDVGQDTVEEVDLVTSGENLGWSRMEGNICYPPPDATCNQTGLTLPINTYTHDIGATLTGGYFYRGSKVPELANKYVFGDFGTGIVYTLTEQPDHSWVRNQLLESGFSISSFGEDHNGELYLVDYNGSIQRFVHQ